MLYDILKKKGMDTGKIRNWLFTVGSAGMLIGLLCGRLAKSGLVDTGIFDFLSGFGIAIGIIWLTAALVFYAKEEYK